MSKNRVRYSYVLYLRAFGDRIFHVIRCFSTLKLAVVNLNILLENYKKDGRLVVSTFVKSGNKLLDSYDIRHKSKDNKTIIFKVYLVRVKEDQDILPYDIEPEIDGEYKGSMKESYALQEWKKEVRELESRLNFNSKLDECCAALTSLEKMSAEVASIFAKTMSEIRKESKETLTKLRKEIPKDGDEDEDI